MDIFASRCYSINVRGVGKKGLAEWWWLISAWSRGEGRLGSCSCPENGESTSDLHPASQIYEPRRPQSNLLFWEDDAGILIFM